MAGKSQVLPADAWVRSSVTERKLEDLVHDGLLRSRASRSQPEWSVPPSSHRELAPSEGYVVSFIAFHERVLGMPPSRFMWALLHYYKVELHHLAPNSISQAVIFAAVYEGYLGMEPHWNLWLHLFKAEHFAKKAGERGSAACGARRQLHPSSPGRSRRALHPGAAHLVEQWMARWVVLPAQ
jgi:hypothetical protein